MKQLNIGIITHNYPPHLGGVEIIAQKQAEKLAQYGHKITVWTSGESNKVTYSAPKVTINQFKPIFKIGNMPFIPQMYRACFSHDVLILNIPFLFGAEIIGLFSKFSKVPLVVFCHSSSADWKSKNLKNEKVSHQLATLYIQYLSTLMLKHTSAIGLVSREQEILRKDSPIRKLVKDTKIKKELIPSGVSKNFLLEPRQKTLDETRVEAAWSGRLDSSSNNYFKNLDLALQAVAQIPNLYLNICGDGEMLNYWINKTQNLNIANKVTFHGKLSHDDLPKVLRASDFILSTSSGLEGMPLSLLEGMAVGKPLVVPSVAGLEELINDNGFIFEANNINSLKKTINHFINLSDEERLAMGNNSYQTVKAKYTWEQNMEKLNKLILDVT